MKTLIRSDSWSVDGFGVDQTLELDVDAGILRRSWCDEEEEELKVEGDLRVSATKFKNIDQLPYKKVKQLLGIGDYGVELNDLANWLGLRQKRNRKETK